MTIVISFISIVSQLLKNYEIEGLPSIRIKIGTGLITGMLSITLMVFSVHIGENTIIDFRNVIITLSAMQGGIISASICGGIIAVFRVAYFGINSSSLSGVLMAVTIALGASAISYLKVKISHKWTYSTFFGLIISSIILSILLKGKVDIIQFLFIYWMTTCLLAVVVFYYLKYCLAANALFRKLQMESSKDFLTGLNNVRSFDSLFNTTIKNVKEKGENLSLLMIDIDFFKKVNDTYGHANGDIVLRELGRILTKSCRSFDIVSRNGGEEFTVLLLDCPKTKAIEIAERIRTGVETHLFTLSSDNKINVTVSIGVASYPETTIDIERLLERADIALYKAKRTGRNRVCLDDN